MSTKYDELKSLEAKALVVMSVTDRMQRHAGGLHLENEARSLDDRYRILGGLDEKAEVQLRAILQIIFDYILYDALEDEDWAAVMPDHYDGDVSELLRGT